MTNNNNNGQQQNSDQNNNGQQQNSDQNKNNQRQTLPSIGQVLGEYLNIRIANGVEWKRYSNGHTYMKKDGKWVRRVINPNYQGPRKVIMLISFILLIFVVLPLTINIIECFPLDILNIYTIITCFPALVDLSSLVCSFPVLDILSSLVCSFPALDSLSTVVCGC